jgi:hypothetical protein
VLSAETSRSKGYCGAAVAKIVETRRAATGKDTNRMLRWENLKRQILVRQRNPPRRGTVPAR